MIELSILIPAYNAGKFLAQTLASVRELLLAQPTFELILVDDGSADDTVSIAESFKNSIPRYTILTLPKNRGKGYALRMAMQKTQGDLVVFTDADLPYGLTPIVSMLAVMKREEDLFLLYGSRSHENSKVQQGYTLLRKFGRMFFSVVIRTFIVSRVVDTQCGIKMFRGALARAIVERGVVDRFAFDIECFMIAKARGWRYADFPVALNHRKESSVRIVRDTLCILGDIVLINLRYLRGRYTN